MTERLAIDGGIPARKNRVPAWPIFGEREEELLLEVLRSGDWGTLTGTRVKTFERQFAAFQAAAFGICVPNGSLALELALEALGVGPGDEVITSAYTFIATVGSIFSIGARPVFVDIDPATNTIDPGQIEGAITGRTKAIVPVHVGGVPSDMDGVLEIARRHGIPVLEDACQAWGAAWKGTPVGALGDIGTFSFQASKNITAGEGGIVVTNDVALHDQAWSIHNTGRSPHGGTFEHEIPGRNLRMTEWQGAILIAQLERLPEHMATRQRNATHLTTGLPEIPGLQPLRVDDRVTSHAWHLFQTRYDAAAFGGRSRADFITALDAEGVPCMAGYVPLTHQKAIRNALQTRFGGDAAVNLPDVPHAARSGEETVWFEQTLLLGTDDDIDQVIAACRKIHRAWR
jgi:dTDP-4-amino-4,6-dideoxygalactose transaminase